MSFCSSARLNATLIYFARLVAQRLEEEKVLAMTDTVLQAIKLGDKAYP